MISQEVFSDCMSQLFKYYGKSDDLKSSLVMSAWFDKINAFLDNKQLINATKRSFQKYAFRPSVDQFVELITGDDEIPALEDWQTILNYVRENAALYNMGKAPALILSCPQADKALLMVGGIGKVIKPSEDPKYDDLNLKELKKQFIDLWSKYKRAIALGQVEPPPKMIKAGKTTPIDLTQKREDIPAGPDAFATIKANLKKSHPAFAQKIEESPTPQPPTPVLLPNEVAAKRAEHDAAFKASQEMTKKLVYLAQK